MKNAMGIVAKLFYPILPIALLRKDINLPMLIDHPSRKLLTFLIAVSVILAGCGAPENEVAKIAATATLLPIVSHTPRLTATPIPTRTPFPTFTFTPSPTTPAPSATNTLVPTATPTVVGIIQSIQRVNIRNGPGVDFEAFEALAPGTGVQIIGQNAEGSWYNIRLEDGDEGWVVARLLYIADTPTPFPTATASPNMTALFLGTPLPTAIIGGGTVTPTPPGAVQTSTPVGGNDVPSNTDTPAPDATATSGLQLDVPIVVVDLDSINMTATALVGNSASPTPNPDATELTIALVTLTPSDDGDSFNTPVPRNLDAPTTEAGATNPPVSSTQIPTQVVDGESVEVPTRTANVRTGVDVFAFCNNNAYGIAEPENLSAGSSIEIFWAWFASDDEKLNQHVNNATHELRVNGTQIANVDQFRQSPVTRGADRASYWYVPFGPLAAGEYLITYRVTWGTTITDGYSFYGPGTSTEFEEESCNFIVQ
jgi:hypothetical protein